MCGMFCWWAVEALGYRVTQRLRVCGGAEVHEMDGCAVEESENRGGECGLTVWIGMVCVVGILGWRYPSGLGNPQWPLGRGGAACIGKATGNTLDYTSCLPFFHV